MKISEIQEIIYNDCNMKTSVKKGVGSMRGYLIITPMFQRGEIPYFPHEITMELRGKYTSSNPLRPNYFTTSQYCLFGAENDSVKYKRECKPKPLEEMKARQWGSKNSQIRLDKATRRNAKRLQKGNTARYY